VEDLHSHLRRRPRQRRSREIVRAIVEAGLRVLEERGPQAITTNHIAERAGVSIGSLYRYFPNKEAILAAIYEERAAREASDAASGDWVGELAGLPLEQIVRQIVGHQFDRHRDALSLDGDFYRAHHRAFSIAPRVGPERLDRWIGCVLERNRTALRVDNMDHAAFLLTRGISAIVRIAVEERPDLLADETFREAVVDLVIRHLCKVPDPGRPGSGTNGAATT
jgi:AcrR family transcriptional regulator